MNKVILGYSRSRSPWKIGSKVIQETEKRNFSHCYIVYICPITGVKIVSQASHGFVNEMNYDIFCIQNVVVEEYSFNCSDEQFLTILKYMKLNLGKPYSKLQLVLIGIKKLLHFEINIRNGNEAFICSEWQANIAKMMGIEVPDELDYETPSDINLVIKNA